MIRIQKSPELNITYDLSRIGAAERLLFFDIETTGLSAYDASVYLIGCLYTENGRWQFRQWLSESLSDELPMLREFFDFAALFDTLVHFNGDTFDIGFLEATAAQYTLPSPLKSMRSFDILKAVRRYKNLFQLPNLKQKSIEVFLGIDREDRYSGGELISVYNDYQYDRREDLRKLLLIHNEEDVIGMSGLLPILSYPDFVCSFPENAGLPETYANRSGSRLTVSFAVEGSPFPKPLSVTADCGISLHFHADRFEADLPVFSGSLKYFYPNYKDYYYLPKEDCAIHRKLAQFVDKQFREPANKDNCYTRMEGRFLPAIPGTDAPVFRRAYKDADAFRKIEDGDAFIIQYIRELFSQYF